MIPVDDQGAQPDEQEQPVAPADTTVSDAAEPELLCDSDLGKAMVDLIKQFDLDEDNARYRNVLKWRKHLLYWNNIQYLVESLSDRDWLTPEQVAVADPETDFNPALYAKVVNVFKAHGEIFIGALSAGLPTVKFFPADADNPEDIMTAKAFSKLSEMLQRQNKARLLLMKALFILYNQGLIACYNENKEDERFGMMHIPEFETIDVLNREHLCPSCGFSFGTEQYDPQAQEEVPDASVGESLGAAGGGQANGSPAAPAQPPTMPTGGPLMSPQTCPQCGLQVQPDTEDTPGTQEQATGTRTEPKNREILEVYGPLNVKIPMWVRDQQGTPYLNLETEESTYFLKSLYPEIDDKIVDSGYAQDNEREARIPAVYRNDFPKGVSTVSRCWVRPWAYTYIKDEEIREQVKKDYPDGVYTVIINKEFCAECLNDKLDDHWTLSENPVSEVLHVEPKATSMVPLQDMTNELVNITLETVEFGISETFVESTALDFDGYQAVEAKPGQLTPASIPAGAASLAAGFHSIKPATLSGEVEPFAERLTQTTQFVMGSYPSVYGGQLSGGSGTAREYELSKSSALQRWSTDWTIIQEWWAAVMNKATRSAARNMIEDQKFVKSVGSNFMNVWIKQSELTGEVGDVQPEVAETFPISWSQKRDVILDMIKLGNPMIESVIAHPENASLVASIVGVPELFIPGDDDRNKQLAEIAQMSTEEPIEGPPQMGPMGPVPGQMQSSIPINPDLDNNTIEAQVCKAWLVGPVGQSAKRDAPAWYANVLAHYMAHTQAAQMDAMKAAMAAAPPGGPDKSGQVPSSSGPGDLTE